MSRRWVARIRGLISTISNPSQIPQVFVPGTYSWEDRPSIQSEYNVLTLQYEYLSLFETLFSLLSFLTIPFSSTSFNQSRNIESIYVFFTRFCKLEIEIYLLRNYISCKQDN